MKLSSSESSLLCQFFENEESLKSYHDVTFFIEKINEKTLSLYFDEGEDKRYLEIKKPSNFPSKVIDLNSKLYIIHDHFEDIKTDTLKLIEQSTRIYEIEDKDIFLACFFERNKTTEYEYYRYIMFVPCRSDNNMNKSIGHIVSNNRYSFYIKNSFDGYNRFTLNIDHEEQALLAFLFHKYNKDTYIINKNEPQKTTDVQEYKPKKYTESSYMELYLWDDFPFIEERITNLLNLN